MRNIKTIYVKGKKMIHLKCRLDRTTYCLDYVGKFERVCYHIRMAWWAVTRGYTYMKDDAGFNLSDEQAILLAYDIASKLGAKKNESKQIRNDNKV